MPSSTPVHSRISYGSREYLVLIALSCCLFKRRGRYVGLDITNGKMSLGGDGSKRILFTSRTDIARYLSYVLTHLPADQLKNRSFTIAGDTKVCAFCCGSITRLMKMSNQSFNEIVKEYEAKTGKKVEVTYIPVSELDARLASNPQDIVAYLHKLWATTEGPFKTDNHLYPNWNPSSVADNIPIA